MIGEALKMLIEIHEFFAEDKRLRDIMDFDKQRKFCKTERKATGALLFYYGSR